MNNSLHRDLTNGPRLRQPQPYLTHFLLPHSLRGRIRPGACYYARPKHSFKVY